jgi:hypothetical protein
VLTVDLRVLRDFTTVYILQFYKSNMQIVVWSLNGAANLIL